MLQGNWYVPDLEGKLIPHSLLYWTDKNNPQGQRPVNPAQDPQFDYWEYGVRAWYTLHPELFSPLSAPPVPLSADAPPTLFNQ